MAGGIEESFTRRRNLVSTNVFRALHRGEIAELELAVDIYGKYFCAFVYGDVDKHVITEISKHYGCVGGVVKYPQKDPHNAGWVKELEVVGEKPTSWFEVNENGMRFKVTLTEKQHAGLFLDQRDNRNWVKENSKDKMVANLFSYTCSFSVAAGLGGAKKIHSVDISKPFLDWGKENFELNSLNVKDHLFFADDVRDWLKRRLKSNDKFDIIICDPPSFSKGAKNQKPFKVEREWPELCESIAKIMNPKGTAIFSNNLQERPDKFFKNHLQNHFVIEEVPTQADFAGTFHARYFKATRR
jgi:23S rRNA G2069 N7-methylase RlmK/C1962 C5-methylase RlmI